MKNKFGDKQTSYEKVLDYFYDNILKLHVPKEFDNEIAALTQGAWEAGVNPDVNVGQTTEESNNPGNYASRFSKHNTTGRERLGVVQQESNSM